MRCYNGCIPESDYFRRFGYYQEDYYKLLRANPHILITWFPIEGKYSACVPKENYRDLGGFCLDKMDCLEQAIKIYLDQTQSKNENTRNKDTRHLL